MERSTMLWVLERAAGRNGFMPHAKSTVGLLSSLETEGLVRQSEAGPIWYITDKGREELTRLRGAPRET